MFLYKEPKSPYFYIVYRVKGKKRRFSTGTANREEAERKLKDFVPPAEPPVRSVKQQEKEPAIIPPAPRVHTLVSFKEEYTASLASTKSANYIRSIKLAFKMIINNLGDIPLTQIDRRTVDQFISATFSRTHRGAALYYRTLKAAFSTAENWQYIETNPFKKVKLPKLSQSFPAFITPDQLQQVINLTTRPEIAAIFSTAFYTGMRLSEILNLKAGSVDLEKNIIHLRNTEEFTTKSKKERIIPVAPPLKIALEEYLGKKKIESPYYFINEKGKKLDSTYVSKIFKKKCRAAGLDEQIHFHSLRHSFASNLVQKGASIFVVKELLGHEDIKTTMVYSHLNQESLKNAVNLL